MQEQERRAWLALAWGAELGPAGFDRLLHAYGTAEAALQAPETELIYGEARLRPQQAVLLPTLAGTLERYAKEAADLAARGISVFLSPDAGYPAPLRDLPHPPPVLCVRGKLLPIDDLALAIVGTRSPSRQGADFAGDLAAHAAADDFTIVSGLARGIDTAAHLGALGRQGRTLAVIGNGICHVHPPENAELADRITGQGAVLSELPPQAEPTVPNLMARNRLISVLSRGVVVVECGGTGGSLSTAQAAVQQGRALYAVAWPEPRDKTVGNQQLLAEGARALHGQGEVPALCQALRARHPLHGRPAGAEAPKSQMTLF